MLTEKLKVNTMITWLVLFFLISFESEYYCISFSNQNLICSL